MDIYNHNQTEAPVALSLYELNSLVAEAISIGVPGQYWVEAEISEAREVRGHCYLELVEKDDRSNTPVARASAKCWQNRWSIIRPMFERVTGQRLHAGMKVMLRVYANFHEAYGFSWIVSDINPEYTLGDLARRRKEIVERLKADGVFDLQRELILPMFAQRIAVVSSEGAAGFGDFCRQLHDNAGGYQFDVRLFPAVMQGEAVERSVVEALNAIYEVQERYDCVVIIRGGGATSDLSGFDTLALAENVANFPLPIITGIGHDRDETVLDLVAFAHVKTPTAAAQLLVEHLSQTAALADRLCQRVVLAARRRMEMEQGRLRSLASRIPVLFSLVGEKETGRLDRLTARINSSLALTISAQRQHLDRLAASVRDQTLRRITAEQHRLEMLERRVEAENPERLLKRGYSITTYKGRTVRDASQLPPDAEVETRVENGSFRSRVVK